MSKHKEAGRANGGDFVGESQEGLLSANAAVSVREAEAETLGEVGGGERPRAC